jgi:predicted dienelactone hydrolase
MSTCEPGSYGEAGSGLRGGWGPLVAVLLAGLLPLACDDTSRGPNGGSDDAGPSDVGPGDDGSPGCSASPPAAPSDLDPVCQQWSCTATSAPQCWDCAATPTANGATCTQAGGEAGICMGGSCLPPQDPGNATGVTFTSTTQDVTVASGTTVPVTIYLPAAAALAPVVVFHHGFQLDPSQYASYGEHLAGWGYVVVMPKMPGGLIGGPTHRDLADYLEAILDWIEANGATAGGPLQGKADATRIALAGHSMGGKVSMLVASEDARPKAVFGVDPVDAAGSPLATDPTQYPSVTPELMGSIHVPFVALGETTNATCSGIMCQACAPEADNFHQYFTNASSPALEIEVKGANHMSFLDDPNCGMTCSVCPTGTDNTAVTRYLTRRAMTAFFNVQLFGIAAYSDYLTGNYMNAEVADGLVAVATRNGF